MNKADIKSFAVSARKILINNASLYDCDVEEASFICFSRIIMMHYMKVNGYTSSEFFEAIPDYVQDIFDKSYAQMQASLNEINKNDFKNPEIIGWLYQYFNSELKDEIFALLQDNIRVSKENIPAATQIFTPQWIVKYLIENSLGILFGKKIENWEYYIDDIIKPQNNFDVTKIKLIDPCMGCGNILLYAFDVFMDIYKYYGFKESEAAKLILENNIYGLDIDDRAYRLACFALMMKARSYDKNIFNKNVKLNLCAIKEDNKLFVNAKEYGSLLKINDVPNGYPLEKQAKIISQKYDVVVTNPPYMGRKSLNPTLKEFIDTHYADGKSELYSAFIIACIEMLKENGMCAMITIHTWMFISSFAKLRKYILNNTTISSMLHTGAATFEELNAFNALATAFCLSKSTRKHPSVFIRLADYYTTEEKLKNYGNADNKFILFQNEFNKIPQAPFTYWISNNIRKKFTEHKPLKYYCAPKQGLATGENKRFLRYWYEVKREEIGFGYTDISQFHSTNKKYAPYNKGGDFRKWYGNNEFVIKFDKENYEILSKQGNNLPSKQYYFKEGITWSLFGFENFSVRYKPCGFVFDVSGSSMFPEEDNAKYILAFLSSKVAFLYLSVIAPTVNFQVGNIASLPLIINESKKEEIEKLVDENIALSKADWDSFETSWDFSIHPLVGGKGLISDCFKRWQALAQSRYDKLKSNEEQLNKIFIEIYSLQNELSPDVISRDIAIRTADLRRDIKSLISYGVGCMFGRYGDGNFDIIPLKNIAGHFAEFIENQYGKPCLEENLDYIASALGNRGKTSSEVIENYFIKDFYKDHYRIYKKHPIYRRIEIDGLKVLTYIHKNPIRL